MQAFRIEAKLSQNGKLSLKGLPFRKDEQVEVIILAQKPAQVGADVPSAQVQKKYSLRNQPIIYHQPFESIAENEWAALK